MSVFSRGNYTPVNHNNSIAFPAITRKPKFLTGCYRGLLILPFGNGWPSAECREKSNACNAIALEYCRNVNMISCKSWVETEGQGQMLSA